MACSERESVRALRGDCMRSESCAEVLSEGVSRPVISAVAVACAELALCCDVTVLESLEESCMRIRIEVRCNGRVRKKKSCARRDSKGAVNFCAPFNEAADMTSKILEVGTGNAACMRCGRDVFYLPETTLEETMSG